MHLFQFLVFIIFLGNINFFRILIFWKLFFFKIIFKYFNVIFKNVLHEKKGDLKEVEKIGKNNKKKELTEFFI